MTNTEENKVNQQNKEKDCCGKLCGFCVCNIASGASLIEAIAQLEHAATLANYIGLASASSFCCFTLLVLPCLIGGVCDDESITYNSSPVNENIER